MDEFGIYMIWAYNRSKADRYYTFCNPECANAIDTYLDYRRSFHEEIKDKSPLIREEFNIDDDLRVKYPRFLSQRMFCFVVEDVLKRAGVNQITAGNKRREVMRSHGFRKFFITQCDKAHMPFTVREFISGHRLPNQDASYVLRTEEETLAEYVKAIPLLTIDPTQRLQTRVKELESEHITKEDLEELRRQWMLELQKERAVISLSEWNALRAEMDELRKFVFPGPVPRNKQMRNTYLKVVKSHYKDEKGIDIVGIDDVSSNNLE